MIVVVDCDSFSAEEWEEEQSAAISSAIFENKSSAIVKEGRLRVCLIAMSAKGVFSCNLLKASVVNVEEGKVGKRKGIVTVAVGGG